MRLKISEYRALARSQTPWVLGYWNTIFGKFSIYLSYILAHTSASPNQVTLISGFVAFLAAAMVQSSIYLIRLIGVVALFIALLLDDCDGDIARYKNMASAFGQRLDLVVDGARDIALTSAVSWLAFEQLRVAWIIWAGSLAVGGTMLYFYSSAILYGFGTARKWSQSIALSGVIARFCISLLEIRYAVMSLLIVVNYVQAYLIFAAASSFGATMLNSYSAWKESSRLTSSIFDKHTS